ncbi:CD244 protein, partial [Chunga burmeisteri]|nr:CD244 protein [Chunga burmeisteri]
SASGPPECREEAVSAGGTLRLLPEKTPQGWAKVHWKVRLGAGHQHRILTAEGDKVIFSSKGPFSGRAGFQQETLSLRLSSVSAADGGVYWAEFEDPSGAVTSRCFHVSVWEPIHQPRLDAHILHWEQGWCNLSLLCTVPSATNISYNWSCSGDPLGTLGHRSRLLLWVGGDFDPGVCWCNASNPVSWKTSSTDVAAACRAAAPGFFGTVLWWTVAMALGLALIISVAFITCYWRRKRGKDAPAGEHSEQTLTIYNEVGKTRTGQDPVSTRGCYLTGDPDFSAAARKPRFPSVCQPGAGFIIPLPPCLTAGSRSAPQPPSLKRKRLDPALISTAYVEVTGTGPARR